MISIAPLVWTPRGQPPLRWWYSKVHNRTVYEIVECPVLDSLHGGTRFSVFHWKPDKLALPDDYLTLAEAQAAAQVDWDQFIRAALTP